MNDTAEPLARATQSTTPPAVSLRANTARIRLLATTDVHLRLTDFDYIADRPSDHHGLAGISTMIETARKEAREQEYGCLLFDNGDMLQGAAMGKWLAHQPVTREHPVIASMNALRYDAVGIGNHDLDFGLDYLRQVTRELDMPVIASNLEGRSLDPLLKSALINCELPAPQGGQEKTITVGVLSVLPALTSIWNHHLLDKVAIVKRARSCIAKAIPSLRENGADIVVVLAHMGLADGATHADQGQDTALGLTHIPGIDAMIMGHTHRRFPIVLNGDTAIGPKWGKTSPQQVPAVMPGHAGSDLAVLDLTLNQTKCGRWRVVKHTTSLRQNNANTLPDKIISKAALPAHTQLRKHLATTVGQTPVDLHNFFSIMMPTSTEALQARTIAAAIRQVLANTDDGALPLLVATSAHSAGGREGPDHYLHIPKGPVLRRHLAGMDPYDNQVWAIRITGIELLKRLEHAARIYTHLRLDQPDQLLVRDDIASFNFDTIYGVTYQIDPSKPVNRRIRNLRYKGVPVTGDQRFILGTNQFRAAGGGGYARAIDKNIALRSQNTVEQALLKAFQKPQQLVWNHEVPWSLVCTTPCNAVLHTTPLAHAFLNQAAAHGARMDDMTDTGFARIRLTL